MKIIALSGKMRSGKTTLGALFEKHLRGCNRVSFGDEVRREVARGMGYDSNDWKFPFTTHDKSALRPVLQAWGHNMRNVRGENYWIDKLMTRILGETIYNDDQIWVIDDVRYINELEAITGLEYDGIGHYNYHIFRLECDEDTQVRRGCDPEHLTHKSEIEFDDYTWNHPYTDVIDSNNDDCAVLFFDALRKLYDIGFIEEYEMKDAVTDFQFHKGMGF
jgi:dephospho-CoA kinase